MKIDLLDIICLIVILMGPFSRLLFVVDAIIMVVAKNRNNVFLF